MAKLIKEVTKEIVNPSDRGAIEVELYKIIPEDLTVFCNLIFEDRHINSKRVYSYDGSYKNIIFDDITEEEINYIMGIELENIIE